MGTGLREMTIDTPSLNQQTARLERTGRRHISDLVFVVLFFSGIPRYLAGQPNFCLPLWRSILPRK